MPIKTRVTETARHRAPRHHGWNDGRWNLELALAVSNAGGLGTFAIHNAGSLENAREWIRRTKRLTSKPFGVNLTILPSMIHPITRDTRAL